MLPHKNTNIFHSVLQCMWFNTSLKWVDDLLDSNVYVHALSSGLNLIRKPDWVKSGSEQFTLAGKDLLRRGRCCNQNFLIFNIKAMGKTKQPYPHSVSPLNSFLSVWFVRCLGELASRASRLWTWRLRSFTSSSCSPLLNKVMLDFRELLTSDTAGGWPCYKFINVSIFVLNL